MMKKQEKKRHRLTRNDRQHALQVTGTTKNLMDQIVLPHKLKKAKRSIDRFAFFLD